ncbi:DUF2254 domain-containing protein [Nocardioides sediminis]|uniref:DUF2254 domain-containing protein n=1 Tax=Nocardioides sediminis TaxID=433648 RepID=UPI000D318BCB|nr:DUF2254 domain-containing protein [Nocardioides sediminis]
MESVGSASRPGTLTSIPDLPRDTAWARLWQPFWAVPTAIVVAAFVLGLVLPALDSALAEHVPFVFEGGPDGARSLLSTIASAMISVTGLVFSITIVVLQLASSQFTPRILGTFLQSRTTQVTLGVFTASFVYSLTVMRSVQGDFEGGGAFVPQLSVTVAFVLVSASVAMFVAFIHHITRSIQVAHVVGDLGNDTVRLVRRLFPEEPTADHDAAWEPRAGWALREVDSGDRTGHVTSLDHHRLAAVASEHDVVIESLVSVGDYAVEGQPLLRIHRNAGTATDADLDAVAETAGPLVRIDRARTLEQDAAFGVRQLVDIAERALSPGINDPTTAVQVLDQLHRVSRELVTRHDLPRVVGDRTVLLVHRPHRVADLLLLAMEEIAHYGRDSLQVPRRLEGLLDDLDRVAHPAHHAALREVRGRILPGSH